MDVGIFVRGTLMTSLAGPIPCGWQTVLKMQMGGEWASRLGVTHSLVQVVLHCHKYNEVLVLDLLDFFLICF